MSLKNNKGKLCCKDGCENVAQNGRRGLCATHYENLKVEPRNHTKWPIATYVNIALEYQVGDNVNYMAEKHEMTPNKIREIVRSLQNMGVKFNRQGHWYKDKYYKN